MSSQGTLEVIHDSLNHSAEIAISSGAKLVGPGGWWGKAHTRPRWLGRRFGSTRGRFQSEDQAVCRQKSRRQPRPSPPRCGLGQICFRQPSRLRSAHARTLIWREILPPGILCDEIRREAQPLSRPSLSHLFWLGSLLEAPTRSKRQQRHHQTQTRLWRPEWPQPTARLGVPLGKEPAYPVDKLLTLLNGFLPLSKQLFKQVVKVSIHVVGWLHLLRNFSLDGRSNRKKFGHNLTKPDFGNFLQSYMLVTNLIPTTGLTEMNLALNTLTTNLQGTGILLCLRILAKFCILWIR